MGYDALYPSVTGQRAAYRIGNTITVGVYNSGVTACLFLTRWGRTFTESSLMPQWSFMGRVKMVGPWFGDDSYAVLAATLSSPQAAMVVTESADVEGIPLDAPLMRPIGLGHLPSGLPHSVPLSLRMLTDMVTGERLNVSHNYVDVPGETYSCVSSVHIAQRDSAWLLDWHPNYALIPAPDYVYKKSENVPSSDIPGTDPEVGFVTTRLRTRSVINWADGTTEERMREGADTKIQRISIQFFDTPATPNIPVIQGETALWIDPSQPVTVTLDYSADLAGAQTALVWKRVLNNVTEYWNQTTQTWQPTPFENIRANHDQTFPAAAFPVNSTSILQVAAKGTVGGLSGYSDPVTVDTNPAPTAAIAVEPYDAGSGAVTALNPVITASGVPAAGQTLTGFHVEVLDSTGALFANETVDAGVGPWQLVTPLPNGTTGWTARVRVQQTGGGTSEWVSSTFDVAAAVPGVPSVAAAATVHETSSLPMVSLTVDLPWETDGFDYGANPVTLETERSLDEGESWTPAGVVTPVPGWASGITIDDEAPAHLPALYRVRASAVTAYGGSLVGGWGYSVAPVAAETDGRPWLAPLGFPELAVPVDLVSEADGRVMSGQKGTVVLGASHQVVTGVASVLGEGGYVARTDTPDDETGLVSLLSAGHLLSLTMCPEKDSRGDTHDLPRRWFRVVGDIGVARVTQGPRTARLVSWTVAPQPAPTLVRE